MKEFIKINKAAYDYLVGKLSDSEKVKFKQELKYIKVITEK